MDVVPLMSAKISRIHNNANYDKIYGVNSKCTIVINSMKVNIV